jgi:hypothetical protein
MNPVVLEVLDGMYWVQVAGLAQKKFLLVFDDEQLGPRMGIWR